MPGLASGMRSKTKKIHFSYGNLYNASKRVYKVLRGVKRKD